MKIDKGIPIPKDGNTSRGRPIKHPFRNMEIGDSVEYRDDKQWRSAKSAMHTETKKGKKFCSKRLIDGIRVWRIE